MKETGFKDKNGKEICIGDTLLIRYQASKYSSAPGHKWEDEWEVFWCGERGCIELKNDKFNWTPCLWSEIRDENGGVRAEIVRRAND